LTYLNPQAIRGDGDKMVKFAAVGALQQLATPGSCLVLARTSALLCCAHELVAQCTASTTAAANSSSAHAAAASTTSNLAGVSQGGKKRDAVAAEIARFRRRILALVYSLVVRGHEGDVHALVFGNESADLGLMDKFGADLGGGTHCSRVSTNR